MAAVKRRDFLRLGLSGLVLAGCTPDPAGSGAAPPLRVGMELSYPPFEMSDEQGRPAGVSVDLARALAEHLGRALVIENIPFDGLIPALRTGRIDLVISSMTATPARAKAIAFSEPYARIGLCLLAGRDSPVRSLADADAPGRVIAVKQGTTGHLYATANFKHAKLLVLDKESSAVLEVAQGKADAFIYDQLSAWQNGRRHPDTTRAILAPFQTEAWAIGLRQGDDALRTQVNDFLRAFKAGGGFERLGDRWLAEARAAFQAQGIPFVF
ncbi:MAG TPA: transporter substrate-binding domain-containing protein [Verrucomicrobiota bacterium]|nr:transporter substrate-binding domain-containing protein [Verrucomicrobiota bacterium]